MTPRRYDINLRALSLLWFLAPLIANHEEAVSRGVSWEQRSLFVLSGYLITGIPVPAPGGIPSALLLAALSPHLSSVLRHDRPRVCDVASRSSIDDKLSASPKAS